MHGLAAGYFEYYNTERLHSAIGDVTPKDKIKIRTPEILAARGRSKQRDEMIVPGEAVWGFAGGQPVLRLTGGTHRTDNRD